MPITPLNDKKLPSCSPLIIAFSLRKISDTSENSFFLVLRVVSAFGKCLFSFIQSLSCCVRSVGGSTMIVEVRFRVICRPLY